MRKVTAIIMGLEEDEEAQSLMELNRELTEESLPLDGTKKKLKKTEERREKNG